MTDLMGVVWGNGPAELRAREFLRTYGRRLATARDYRAVVVLGVAAFVALGGWRWLSEAAE